VVRLHAEDQVEAVHRLLRLPAPPVGDGLADQRVHVARLDLEDVVEQGEGLRVVAARARDERAAQEARHVDADLFDLLPQVPVLQVQGGRLLVRREGLRSTAEVRQRVAFHLEGRGTTGRGGGGAGAAGEVAARRGEMRADGMETGAEAGFTSLEFDATTVAGAISRSSSGSGSGP